MGYENTATVNAHGTDPFSKIRSVLVPTRHQTPLNVSGVNKPPYPPADPAATATEGIRQQVERLERNVAEVARDEQSDGSAEGSRERALVEQQEIVRSVRANARALEAANETVGTILDIKV